MTQSQLLHLAPADQLGVIWLNRSRLLQQVNAVPAAEQQRRALALIRVAIAAAESRGTLRGMVYLGDLDHLTEDHKL